MAVNLYADDNTLRFTLTGLTDASTGTVINTATVTYTIYNVSDGTEITGETWPLTATADGSGGDYSSTISADANIIANSYYRVEVDITSGTNKGHLRKTIQAEDRTW